MAEPATIRTLSDQRGRPQLGTPLPVDFNPHTLTLVISNQLEEGRQTRGARGRPAQQLVASSEVKLSLELIFDGTLDGNDVRSRTAVVAEMMRPGTVVPGQRGKKRPAMVRFAWANFVFDGMITEYNETLDYFSAEGVPLRAALKLAITKHEAAFPDASGQTADTGQGSVPPVAPVASGQSVSDVANSTGNSGADTTLAQANGLEDMRNV
ncbi:MAG: hypothetical protein AAF580_06790, partial [Pseudomonadota bacterium]